jgi:DUF4097 and DUF4098 domain-containing protein YvlB
MKFKFSITAVLLSALLLCGAIVAQAQKHPAPAKGKDKSMGVGKGEGTGRGEGMGQGTGQVEGESISQVKEATVATTETVNVSLTTGSGRITLHGWDRKEVRAQTTQADTKIEMRQTGGVDAATPATRVEILVYEDSEDNEAEDAACEADTDVTVNVPRGATVYLKTENGDIEVDGIAEAHLETTAGRIEAHRISKATEAKSVNNDIAVEDASGRVRLTSFDGVIEVRDLRSSEVNDFVKINTTSGDILLERIGPARVDVSTIGGELRLMGPLARGGVYNFTTTTGDVTILLPVDTSFQLNAKISEGGEIDTEFPLTYKGATSPQRLLQAGRLFGTYGTGEAAINLVSFSGTLRLRKQ